MITPAQSFPAAASVDDRTKGINRLVSSLKQNPTRPILLGPWRSELGFEALYWLPFLSWLKTVVPNFDARAAVVTRGGLAPLYAGVATTGIDVYALRSVQEVRRENLSDHKRTRMQKQTSITDWDTEVLDDAALKLGLGPVYDLVHPAHMYWAFTPFWDEHVSTKYLAQMTRFEALPTLPKPDGLPTEYVAVKFYGRATFPYPDHQVSAFLQKVCGTIAAQIPVVSVMGGDYDDHIDIPLTGENIVTATPAKAEENLRQQAAILQHAKAVVGTYGGMMQLALRLGVPTVSFWKELHGTARAHLMLSQALSLEAKVPFLTGSIGDVGLWSQVLTTPMVQVQPPISAVA